MRSVGEPIAEMYLGFAIGALLSGGYSLRSAKNYLARHGRNESEDADEPIDLAVRGAMAAITEVLGPEADVDAFLDRESVWRIFESGEFEVITREMFSRDAAQRIITHQRRASRPRLRLVGETMEC